MNKQTSNYKIDFLDLIEISVATVNLHKRVDEKTGKKIVSAFSNNFTKPVYKNGRRFTQANQVIKIEPEDLTKIFESCVFKFGSHLVLRIKKNMVETMYDSLLYDAAALVKDSIDGYINMNVLAEERDNCEEI